MTTHRFIARVVLAFWMLGLAGVAEAQTTQQAVAVVKLVDGSELLGVIKSRTPHEVVLVTLAGPEIVVPRDRIKSIAESQGSVVDGEFWREDPLTSKLFLGPTGRSLRKGEGYFAINALFLPAFQVGVTDRFSIGVGKPFYFFTPATYITPKFQVYRGDRACVSAGLLHLFVPGLGIGGLAYSSATIGTRQGAVTVGGGWIYARHSEDGGAPVVMIGGDKRMTRRSSFVTDNFIFHGGAIVSAGARIVGRTVSYEAGGVATLTQDGAAPPGIFFNIIFHSAR